MSQCNHPTVHVLLRNWNQNSNTVIYEKCCSYLSISIFSYDEYFSYLLLLRLFLELLLWLFLWHSWQPTITWSLIKSVDKFEFLGLRLNCSTSVELHWGQDSKWPRWVNTECEASEAPLWRRLEAMTSIHEILALHSNLEMNQNDITIYYFDTKTQHYLTVGESSHSF